MKKISENGRSMIEMLGVLAIIGILSVGGLNMITKMSNSRKVNAVMDEIGGLAAKARGIARDYDPESDGNDFAEFLHDEGAYPAELEWKGDEKGDFSGTDDVTYTVTYVHTSSNSALFELEIGDLTEDMCMAITTNNWGSVSTNGFVEMKVNDNQVNTPMGIGDASSACTVTHEGKLTVTLTFR